MGETGLWRTALFISPSVCMLMSLHAFVRVCVRATVCVRVCLHMPVVLQWALPCSLCRVCLLPAKPLLSQRRAPCTGSVTAPRLPRELLQRFPASPQGRRACRGLRRQQRRPQRKKKKNPFTSVSMETPEILLVLFFFWLFLNPPNCF